jgi:uncharacterized protein YbjT (DUF2867 family)
LQNNHNQRNIMKIVVIGGSGLIGSKLVSRLVARGHDPVPASPATGVDAITGEGLADALKGAEAVVDVSNTPNWEDAAALEFFQTATRNLLAAEQAEGVGHHVALSIVGIDDLPDVGYYRAKVAQETLIKAGAVPYTILRATQFFEFVSTVTDLGTDGDTVRLTSALSQVVAADDVAATLAELATGPPLNGTAELGGPEKRPLAEFARLLLESKNDDRHVIADADSGFFGSPITDRTLTVGEDAHIGAIRFADWLSQER